MVDHGRSRRSGRAAVAALLAASALAVAGGTGPARAGAVAGLPDVSLPRCQVRCLSVGDASLVEGDTRPGVIVVPVTLSQPATATVSVAYRVQAASATSGTRPGAGADVNDRAGAARILTFTPSAATGLTPVTKTIAIPVYPDTTDESDETVRVVLSSPVNAVLQRAVAYGTIIDDDPSTNIDVVVGDADLVEGHTAAGRSLSIPVSLSGVPAAPVALTWTLGGDEGTWGKNAAVAGADYGGKTSGAISFAAGTTALTKRVAIPVFGDTRTEAHEAVALTVSAASLPSGVAITRAVGTGTIVDDDPASASDPVPDSMAAIGDSMTRAFSGCDGVLGDCPGNSWSTGTGADINSHYARLLRANPAIAGNVVNVAQSGAKSSALSSQATAAGSVDYATILMGANDACTSTEAGMTSVSTYRSRVATAIGILVAANPDVRILVASVPDIHRLWEVGRSSAGALYAWSTYSICQSMLANPLSMAQTDVDRRARVRQRVIDYNAELADVCADHVNCRFDGNAVFNSPFTVADLSPVDFFHPNTGAQSMLALGTYAVGFNW